MDELEEFLKELEGQKEDEDEEYVLPENLRSMMNLPPLPGLDIGPDIAIGGNVKGEPLAQGETVEQLDQLQQLFETEPQFDIGQKMLEAEAAEAEAALRTGRPEPQPNAELRSYDPTLRENIGNFVYDMAKGAGLENQANRMRNEAMIGAELAPGTGDVLAAERAADAFGRGDYGEAAFETAVTSLGLVPVAGIIAKGVGKALRAAPLRVQPRLLSDVDPTAPIGIYTYESGRDVLKQQMVDSGDVLADLYARSGAPNPERVKLRIANDTRIAASMKINELMKAGKLYTPHGNIEFRVTPDQLLAEVRKMPIEKQGAIDQYIKLKDLTDDMRIRIMNRENPQQAAAIFRGAMANIRNIETVYPDVAQYHGIYRDITQEFRNFMASGPHAVIDSSQKQFLDIHRKNYVPYDISPIDPNAGLLTRMGQAMSTPDVTKMEDWFLQKRNTANIKTIARRVNSLELLTDYVRNAARFKMENDVRGEYIQGMLQSSGPRSIRPSAVGEPSKFPDRVVEVYENGKKVKYTTTRLQRALLQFDPYIINEWHLPYASKRTMEKFTTGAPSLVFAPTTFMRDSVLGWVNTGTTDPVRSIVALGEASYGRALMATKELFEGSFKGIPGLNSQAVANWASHRYLNSMYHLMHQSGGTSASLMRSNVQVSKGALSELSKSLDPLKKYGSPIMSPIGKAAGFWVAMHDLIQEAPRFASFKTRVARGETPDAAAKAARELTGDTTVSGQVYDQFGKYIDADLTHPAMRLVLEPVGRGFNILRNTTPYVNPAVQGIRAAAKAYANDPMGTMARAWLGAGLPTMASFAWNGALGDEYLEYSMKNRTARDMAMNVYVGIPGKPPNEGIEIPLAHELTPMSSPFYAILYGMTKGEDGEEIKRALVNSGLAIMDATVGVSMPQIAKSGAELLGVHVPDTLTAIPKALLGNVQNTYLYTEDNVGLLPENVERLVRAQFGAVGRSVLESYGAYVEGGPEAFAEEFIAQTLKRVPVVKNVIGSKTAVTSFTPDNNLYYQKMDKLDEMLKVWDEHYGDNKTRKRDFAKDKGLMEGREDLPITELGPAPRLPPNNPIFEEYGGLLKSKLMDNEIGMKGLQDRFASASKQLKILRRYTAGNAERYGEYQRKYLDTNRIENRVKQEVEKLRKLEKQYEPLKGKELYGQKSGQRDLLVHSIGEAKKAVRVAIGDMHEARRLKKLIEDNKLDLKRRRDVNILINEIELQRKWILDKQLSTVREVEEEITKDLTLRGLIPPGRKFSIERDFVPFITEPSGGTPN